MKKLTRAASMLLAALTVAGSAATAVSAGSIVKFYPGFKEYHECERCDSLILSEENYVRYNGKYYHTVCREEEKEETSEKLSAVLKPTYEYVTTYAPVVEGGSIYKESGKVLVGTAPVVTVKPSVKPGVVVKPGISVITPGSSIIGGKYFTTAEAKKYLEEYFEDNTYEITMKEGETRYFAAGSYFISSDPGIAYYDYKSDSIIAVDNGTADIYVCTNGGIPYFRLHVKVAKTVVPSTKKTAYLNLEAADWQLSAGEKTTLAVSASDGKTYNDILFDIEFGDESALVGARTGSFTAVANGPVLVRAYSKSNPSVCGKALLFVGNYKNYIYDGAWTATNDGIVVNGWGCDDVVVDYYSYIAGWVQAEEGGILIPVVKKFDAINEDGEKTTILGGSVVDYADLLKEAYGNKTDLVSLIRKYNLYKNGICEDKVTINDIDYNKIFLGQIFKTING